MAWSTHPLNCPLRTVCGDMPENVEQYYKQPQTQEAFEAFVEMLEQESLYCGGAGAQWGEQLLTLSTCDNQRDNGRILVVARETK